MATSSTVRPPDPRRNFALLDLLILVAASAGSFALVRPYLEEITDQPLRFSGFLSGPSPPISPWRVYIQQHNFFEIGSRIAGMLMLGLLAISLRPPWPRMRRLSRRPGFVACVAAASAMAVNALVVGAVATFQSVPVPGVWNPFEPSWRSRVGPAIIATWLLLGLGGRWRADKGLIDRSGRLLGAFWIVETVWPYVHAYALPRLPASWWNW